MLPSSPGSVGYNLPGAALAALAFVRAILVFCDTGFLIFFVAPGYLSPFSVPLKPLLLVSFFFGRALYPPWACCGFALTFLFSPPVRCFKRWAFHGVSLRFLLHSLPALLLALLLLSFVVGRASLSCSVPFPAPFSSLLLPLRVPLLFCCWSLLFSFSFVGFFFPPGGFLLGGAHCPRPSSLYPCLLSAFFVFCSVLGAFFPSAARLFCPTYGSGVWFWFRLFCLLGLFFFTLSAFCRSPLRRLFGSLLCHAGRVRLLSVPALSSLVPAVFLLVFFWRPVALFCPVSLSAGRCLLSCRLFPLRAFLSAACCRRVFPFPLLSPGFTFSLLDPRLLVSFSPSSSGLIPASGLSLLRTLVRFAFRVSLPVFPSSWVLVCRSGDPRRVPLSLAGSFPCIALCPFACSSGSFSGWSWVLHSSARAFRVLPLPLGLAFCSHRLFLVVQGPAISLYAAIFSFAFLLLASSALSFDFRSIAFLTRRTYACTRFAGSSSFALLFLWAGLLTASLGFLSGAGQAPQLSAALLSCLFLLLFLSRWPSSSPLLALGIQPPILLLDVFASSVGFLCSFIFFCLYGFSFLAPRFPFPSP